MRPSFTFLFLVFSASCFSQENDTLKTLNSKTSNFVSFITILDIAQASKDGIYLNGYVVNIEYKQAKKLNGKKIRVSGKVTIVKGLKNLPLVNRFDRDGKKILNILNLLKLRSSYNVNDQVLTKGRNSILFATTADNAIIYEFPYTLITVSLNIAASPVQ